MTQKNAGQKALDRSRPAIFFSMNAQSGRVCQSGAPGVGYEKRKKPHPLPLAPHGSTLFPVGAEKMKRLKHFTSTRIYNFSYRIPVKHFEVSCFNTSS